MYWFGLKSPLTNDYFVYKYNDWDKFYNRVLFWDNKCKLLVQNVILDPFEANSELDAYLKCKAYFEKEWKNI